MHSKLAQFSLHFSILKFCMPRKPHYSVLELTLVFPKLQLAPFPVTSLPSPVVMSDCGVREQVLSRSTLPVIMPSHGPFVVAVSLSVRQLHPAIGRRKEQEAPAV